MEINKIYNENCLETMARMPDGFVDCVVTSPPYYGLRSYGTDPQVWGNHNGCDHVWGESLKYAKQDTRSAEKKREQGASVGGSITFCDITTNGNSGNFCQNCNAWRGELGLEPTFQLYLSHLTDIFREVRRVLKPTGTVWVNLGDSYGTNSGNSRQMQNGNGGNSKEAVQTRFSNPFVEQPKGLHKSLMNIPSRFAIAMTDELQFIQRNTIIWHKPACMPSSAKDRFTVDFENILFFTKRKKYWFEQQLEPTLTFDYQFRDRDTTKLNNTPGRTRMAGLKTNAYEMRNMRTTWTVNFEPSGEEHYASYPTKLVEIPIRAGCPPDGIVYDPFGGTATTAVMAHKLGRNWICSELQPKYAEIANKRLEPYLMQEQLF